MSLWSYFSTHCINSKFTNTQLKPRAFSYMQHHLFLVGSKCNIAIHDIKPYKMSISLNTNCRILSPSFESRFIAAQKYLEP